MAQARSDVATQAALVRDLFARSIEVKRRVMEEHCEIVARMAGLCIAALTAGGKLLLCGNGGSAADAQHLAAELLVRLRSDFDRAPVAAIALALDTSSLTACGNDYSAEIYFERMTRALGRPGDVLIGITTSGTSMNVIRALRAAREIGMRTLGLLGGSGGQALGHCELALTVPSFETGRIQEAHITAGHALVELIEDGLFRRGAPT